MTGALNARVKNLGCIVYMREMDEREMEAWCKQVQLLSCV